MAIKGSFEWRGKKFDDVYGRVERFVFRDKKSVLCSLVLFLDEEHAKPLSGIGPFDGQGFEFEYDLEHFDNIYTQAYKLVKALPKFSDWSDV